jgi:hypothetical protein
MGLLKPGGSTAFGALHQALAVLTIPGPGTACNDLVTLFRRFLAVVSRMPRLVTVGTVRVTNDLNTVRERFLNVK